MRHPAFVVVAVYALHVGLHGFDETIIHECLLKSGLICQQVAGTDNVCAPVPALVGHLSRSYSRMNSSSSVVRISSSMSADMRSTLTMTSRSIFLIMADILFASSKVRGYIVTWRLRSYLDITRPQFADPPANRSRSRSPTAPIWR